MLVKKIHLVISLAIVSVLTGCTTKKTVTIVEPTMVIEKDIRVLRNDFENNIGNKVYFTFDSASLSKEAKDRLQNQARWLIDHPTIVATIEGHCDERGSEEYNMVLGSRRANAAKKFLVNHGVDEERLTIVSYGKKRPETTDHNIEAWKLNRRAVTEVKIKLETLPSAN